MKLRQRASLAIAALTAVPILVAVLPASPATAHGTMNSPFSRVYKCWQEGPESPDSAACAAAVAAGGTQALYDWNEVSQLEAGGRHQQIIPDGQLCSAGRSKYRGLDLARADWPATSISAGSRTLTYHATAPHLYGTFTFYITRAGWSPTQPLRWSDLVQLASYTQNNPTWSWNVNIPSRSGRHVIYSIWQRFNGSNEAFYTCSDVNFGGGNPDPQPQPTTSPTPNPTSSPTPGPQPGGTWAAYTPYAIGAQVTYNGLSYRCRQAHTSLPGWEPPNAAALWLPV
jgi:predicted carbohydrate-binding protein with CBM5 and CBM33 domain